jgi:hypothetical protein
MHRTGGALDEPPYSLPRENSARELLAGADRIRLAIGKEMSLMLSKEWALPGAL